MYGRVRFSVPILLFYKIIDVAGKVKCAVMWQLCFSRWKQHVVWVLTSHLVLLQVVDGTTGIRKMLVLILIIIVCNHFYFRLIQSKSETLNLSSQCMQLKEKEASVSSQILLLSGAKVIKKDSF